jgi:hypothetical protein
MSIRRIATFESKTGDHVEVFRGIDEETRAKIYKGAFDPGIVKTLGTKDQRRFSPEAFPDWIAKGGGRMPYTAQVNGDLAGLIWWGGEAFPSHHFPESPVQPPYTVAFRTAYEAPGGDTFEGKGIGKRLAVAGLADVVALTRSGGPGGLPPVGEAGVWLDTGVGNLDGQALYHHLGNTGRGQEPVGFVDVGIYVPPVEPGVAPQESRVGMIIHPAMVERVAANAGSLVTFEASR